MTYRARCEGRRRRQATRLGDSDGKPLSSRARKMLEDGLASARRGEVKPWGDFTRHVDDK